MAAASTLITSARYDLRDSNSTQYTDAELLDYINRAIEVLDSALLSIDSEMIIEEDTSTTLTSATNNVTAPTSSMSIRSIYISTDQLTKTSPADIYYRRIYDTSTGQPYYWCEKDTSILFDCTADQDYSLKIYYNSKTTALTATTDDMPYNDMFNQEIREAVSITAKNRENEFAGVNSVLFQMFKDAAMARVVSRNYVPKTYRLDF